MLRAGLAILGIFGLTLLSIGLTIVAAGTSLPRLALRPAGVVLPAVAFLCTGLVPGAHAETRSPDDLLELPFEDLLAVRISSAGPVVSSESAHLYPPTMPVLIDGAAWMPVVHNELTAVSWAIVAGVFIAGSAAVMWRFAHTADVR